MRTLFLWWIKWLKLFPSLKEINQKGFSWIRRCYHWSTNSLKCLAPPTKKNSSKTSKNGFNRSSHSPPLAPPHPCPTHAPTLARPPSSEPSTLRNMPLRWGWGSIGGKLFVLAKGARGVMGNNKGVQSRHRLRSLGNTNLKSRAKNRGKNQPSKMWKKGNLLKYRWGKASYLAMILPHLSLDQ